MFVPDLNKFGPCLNKKCIRLTDESGVICQKFVGSTNVCNICLCSNSNHLLTHTRESVDEPFIKYDSPAMSSAQSTEMKVPSGRLSLNTASRTSGSYFNSGKRAFIASSFQPKTYRKKKLKKSTNCKNRKMFFNGKKDRIPLNQLSLEA